MDLSNYSRQAQNKTLPWILHFFLRRLTFGSSPNTMGSPLSQYILLKKRGKKIGITRNGEAGERESKISFLLHSDFSTLHSDFKSKTLSITHLPEILPMQAAGLGLWTLRLSLRDHSGTACDLLIDKARRDFGWGGWQSG
jgi:hypothetical protein